MAPIATSSERTPAENDNKEASGSADGKFGYTAKELRGIVQDVRRTVLANFGLSLADLVLLQPRSIKKTSRSLPQCRPAFAQVASFFLYVSVEKIAGRKIVLLSWLEDSTR